MDLESRITRLERMVRRQWFAGLVVLLVLGGGLLLGQAKQRTFVGIAASATIDSKGVEKRFLYRLWSDGRIDELEHPGLTPTGMQYKWYGARWSEVKLKHPD